MPALFITLTVLWFALPMASAYSPVPTERQRVYSPDRAYFVQIEPRTSRHTIYRAGILPQRQWSFERPIQFETFFLSDDGNSVILVDWRFVQVQKASEPSAVAIYHRNGKVRLFSYQALSRPRRLAFTEVGPVGSFWRLWREDVVQTATGIRLRAPGRGWISIDASTCQVSSSR